MKFKISLLILLLATFSTASGVSPSKEYKLNDRVAIFSTEDGKFWGAKVDGEIILEANYSGIDLLGDKHLRLAKYDVNNNKLMYGSADLAGTIQLPCEYEHIYMLNGEVEALRPTDKDKENSTTEDVDEEEDYSDDDFDDYDDFDSPINTSIVGYIQGDVDKPNINLGLIRTQIKDDDNDESSQAPEHLVIEDEYKPRVKADKMPTFAGGEAKMHEFIRDNLEFPEDAKVLGVQGRVVVRFVVMPNGNVEEVEVLHGLETSCDKEAIRLVEIMPRWIPGVQDDKKVAVYFTLPISFFLTNR